MFGFLRAKHEEDHFEWLEKWGKAVTSALKNAQKNFPAYATGNLEGTLPYELRKTYTKTLPKLMVQMQESKGTEYDPMAALEIAGEALGMGAPFAPSGEATLGVVKGAKFRPWIREAMKKEMRARGAKENITDKIAGGTLFTGRTYENYPSRGEVFPNEIYKRSLIHSHIGEPGGVSLTALPKVTRTWRTHPEALSRGAYRLKRQAEKLYEKEVTPTDDMDLGLLELGKELDAADEDDFLRLMELQEKISPAREKSDKLKEISFGMNALAKEKEYAPFARVLPQYGAPPRDVLIEGWKGGRAGARKSEDVIMEAYLDALSQTKSAWELRGGKAVLKGTEWSDLEGPLMNTKSKQTFTDAYTKSMQRQGFKGMIHSPARFGEFEVRVFDPKDVMMLDLRRERGEKSFRSGLPRYVGLHRTATEGTAKYDQIKEWQETAGHQWSDLKGILRDMDIPRNLKASKEIEQSLLRKAQIEYQAISEFAPESVHEIRTIAAEENNPLNMFAWKLSRNLALVPPHGELPKSEIDALVNKMRGKELARLEQKLGYALASKFDLWEQAVHSLDTIDPKKRHEAILMKTLKGEFPEELYQVYKDSYMDLVDDYSHKYASDEAIWDVINYIEKSKAGKLNPSPPKPVPAKTKLNDLKEFKFKSATELLEELHGDKLMWEMHHGDKFPPYLKKQFFGTLKAFEGESNQVAKAKELMLYDMKKEKQWYLDTLTLDELSTDF